MRIGFVTIATNDGVEARLVDYHIVQAVLETHVTNVHILEHKFRILLSIDVFLELDGRVAEVDGCDVAEAFVPQFLGGPSNATADNEDLEFILKKVYILSSCLSLIGHDLHNGIVPNRVARWRVEPL